jgi:hypothetical protein
MVSFLKALKLDRVSVTPRSLPIGFIMSVVVG